MKLICEKCGEMYDDESFDCGKPEYEYLQTEVGNIPMFVGYSSEEPKCECGGELVEAERCECCGKYGVGGNFNKSVCGECKEKYTHPDNALLTAFNVGNSDQALVKVNGFVSYLLTEEKINEILIDYIKTQKDDYVTGLLASRYVSAAERNQALEFAILEMQDEENTGEV